MRSRDQAFVAALETLRPHVKERTSPMPPGLTWTGFGDAMIVGPDAHEHLEEITEAAYSVLAEESELVSRQVIKEAIANTLLHHERPADTHTVDELRKALRVNPIENWSVSLPVRGAQLRKGEVLQLGPVTLWETPKHADQVGLPPFLLGADAQQERAIIATVKEIRAREHRRAYELADELFVRFENILHYILRWDSDVYNVSIFDYSPVNRIEHFIKSPMHSVSGAQYVGHRLDTPLDHSRIIDYKEGHDRLWSIFSDPSPSKMQTRILAAAEWVGKARRDTDVSKAFVQLVFALEALLQHQERGSLIQPSLTYRMQEACAYLTGTNPQMCQQIAADVEEIYQARSAIVHGGAAEVPKKLRLTTLNLVSSLISKLLTDAELSQIADPRELSKWVQARKYG
jgi:hypothetical protein